MAFKGEIPKLKEVSIPSEDTAEEYDSAVRDGERVVRSAQGIRPPPIRVHNLRPRALKACPNPNYVGPASFWSIKEVRSLLKGAETCCLVDKVWGHASRWNVVQQHMRDDGFNKKSKRRLAAKYSSMRTQFNKLKKKKLQGNSPAVYNAGTSCQCKSLPSLLCPKHGEELYDRMEHLYMVTGLYDGVNVEFYSKKKRAANVGARSRSGRQHQWMTDKEDEAEQEDSDQGEEEEEEEELANCSSRSEDSYKTSEQLQFTSSMEDATKRRRTIPQRNAYTTSVHNSSSYKSSANAGAPFYNPKLHLPHTTSTRMKNNPACSPANKKAMECNTLEQVVLDHMQSTSSHLSEYIEVVKMNIEMVHRILRKQPLL